MMAADDGRVMMRSMRQVKWLSLASLMLHQVVAAAVMCVNE